jgi:thiol-disulfide isomerase/thioredoxin
MYRRWLGLFVLAAFALGVGPAEAPPAPDFRAGDWLNAAPQSLPALRGKVVLVEFWTFGCRNCQNVEPHVRAWHERYAAQGLVVIGVHSPEFAHERVRANLERYLGEHRIPWPVLVDDGFHTWRAYRNRYWPAFYLIDKQGRIRHRRVGEGGYAEMASQIEALLAE